MDGNSRNRPMMEHVSRRTMSARFVPARARADAKSDLGDRVVDLRVELGRLALNNPVLVASGTFGYVREMQGLVRLERLGGVIPKTVTFQPAPAIRPRARSRPPRVCSTRSAWTTTASPIFASITCRISARSARR